MGIYPDKKGISTGTMTRIVINIMEQNKASLENFFSIQLFLLLLLVFALTSNSMCKATLIVYVLTLSLNLKVKIRNVLNMCVKPLLITLTVCKSHFHIYYQYVLQVNASGAFIIDIYNIKYLLKINIQ